MLSQSTIIFFENGLVFVLQTIYLIYIKLLNCKIIIFLLFEN